MGCRAHVARAALEREQRTSRPLKAGTSTFFSGRNLTAVHDHIGCSEAASSGNPGLRLWTVPENVLGMVKCARRLLGTRLR